MICHDTASDRPMCNYQLLKKPIDWQLFADSYWFCVTRWTFASFKPLYVALTYWICERNWINQMLTLFMWNIVVHISHIFIRFHGGWIIIYTFRMGFAVFDCFMFNKEVFPYTECKNVNVSYGDALLISPEGLVYMKKGVNISSRVYGTGTKIDNWTKCIYADSASTNRNRANPTICQHVLSKYPLFIFKFSETCL